MEILRLSWLEPESLPVTFGAWRLPGLLGDGCMGRVFDAEPIGGGGRIALKVALETRRATERDARLCLENEARMGALLSPHPNLAAAREAGERDGEFFIAMEHAGEHSLRDLLQRHGRLPPAAALAIGIAVCEGLRHAHRVLVHRDIKPANILISRGGG